MNNRPIERVIAPANPIRWRRFFRYTIHTTRCFSIHGTQEPIHHVGLHSNWDVRPSAHPRGGWRTPHRGFETVTIAYKGRVEHHDSSGGGGVIAEGDVQWMTAASGVLHKEFHEAEFSKAGGTFQMVQLWVNLPAKYKMSTPKYQAIAHDKMVQVPLPNGGGSIEVIAGNYMGAQGPAKTFTPVHMYNARLSKGGTAEFEFPGITNLSFSGGRCDPGEWIRKRTH